MLLLCKLYGYSKLEAVNYGVKIEKNPDVCIGCEVKSNKIGVSQVLQLMQHEVAVRRLVQQSIRRSGVLIHEK